MGKHTSSFIQAAVPAFPEGVPSVSLINRIFLAANKIDDFFPKHVLAEARAVAGLDFDTPDRVDMTDVDFITIDPKDARDRDDAVCAVPDKSPDNPGGYIIHVAIADVSFYVRPGGALDAEARRRAFSLYLADRAVPMLPDILSADKCSLEPDQRRPAIVKTFRIDAEGQRLNEDVKIRRATIRSRAALSYDPADLYYDGDFTAVPDALHHVMDNLDKAYELLERDAERRNKLNLDVAKVAVVMDPYDDRIAGFDYIKASHSRGLIEAFMVTPNAMCGKFLHDHDAPGVPYRIHGTPLPEKLPAARKSLSWLGINKYPGDAWDNVALNDMQIQCPSIEIRDAVQKIILQSLLKKSAYSSIANPHTGLAEPKYVHLTSPIRRYADLVAQRRLLETSGTVPPGTYPAPARPQDFNALIDHCNARELATEQATAELLALYCLSWLAEREGQLANVKLTRKDTDSPFIVVEFQDCPLRYTIDKKSPSFPLFSRLMKDALPEERRAAQVLLQNIDFNNPQKPFTLIPAPEAQKPQTAPSQQNSLTYA